MMRILWFPLTLLVAALAILIYLLSGNDERAKASLVNEGYENVQITGMSYSWKCGKINALNRNFTATKNGKPVKGAICNAVFGMIHEDS